MSETVTTAPERVRFAERCDLDEVMFLCREMHAENGLLELSEPKVRTMLMGHFNRRGGIIGVIGKPGALEAAVVLHMGQQWYSDEWVLEEFMSFVLPEYRRSNNAKDLIDFSKYCAKLIGVKLLMGIMSNHRTEAKIGLYRRRLGQPIGALFIANAGET